jgi:hypothetical protein
MIATSKIVSAKGNSIPGRSISCERSIPPFSLMDAREASFASALGIASILRKNVEKLVLRLRSASLSMNKLV